jgi:hypothetical protein
MINHFIKPLLKKTFGLFGYEIHALEYIRQLEDRSQPVFQDEWVPRGHFYSPYPDLEQIRARDAEIFSQDKPIVGINLHEEAQLALLHQMADVYQSMPPFSDTPVEGLRYYYMNDNFAHSDGIILHAMLRLLKPKRLVEVGSGFSSAMTLDTNELFFNNSMELTFIDPYPERLYKLMKPRDRKTVTVLPVPVQEVAPDFFEMLEAGDVLFIDSTHVSKIDSDVNYLYFEIFPRLNKGVNIHIHDIFYPFEYPRIWVYEGRVWSESYLLRAFLLFNHAFQITYFQNMMYIKHHEFFKEYMPLCLKSGGDNIWLKKIA